MSVAGGTGSGVSGIAHGVGCGDCSMNRDTGEELCWKGHFAVHSRCALSLLASSVTHIMVHVWIRVWNNIYLLGSTYGRATWSHVQCADKVWAPCWRSIFVNSIPMTRSWIKLSGRFRRGKSLCKTTTYVQLFWMVKFLSRSYAAVQGRQHTVDSLPLCNAVDLALRADGNIELCMPRILLIAEKLILS